jgi:cell wall-associated NlpC family hydrolase
MRGCRTYVVVIAIAALSGACASSGATPRPFPTPAPKGSSPTPNSPHPTPNSQLPTPNSQGPTPNSQGPTPNSASPIAYSVTGTALGLRGTPYRNGGADPSGFDCSGFVQYVFAQHGVIVPRQVSEQFRAGRDVGAQLEPGDLVFFTTVAPGASHVGIAIGGDAFVHAPSSTGEVRVEKLSGPYWSTRFVGARRVL